LVTNDIVICDRYIESSLVLQYYDGVDLQYIWKLNSEFPIPEISITFIADSSILEKRLSERNELTRFEKEISRTEEIELYKKANQFIKSKGFNGHLLYNNNEDDLSRNINTVLNLIENLKEMK
jgi:dTMP kinase